MRRLTAAWLRFRAWTAPTHATITARAETPSEPLADLARRLLANDVPSVHVELTAPGGNAVRCRIPIKRAEHAETFIDAARDLALKGTHQP